MRRRWNVNGSANQIQIWSEYTVWRVQRTRVVIDWRVRFVRFRRLGETIVRVSYDISVENPIFDSSVIR